MFKPLWCPVTFDTLLLTLDIRELKMNKNWNPWLWSHSAVTYKAKGSFCWTGVPPPEIQNIYSGGAAQTGPRFKLNSLYVNWESQLCVMCGTKPGQSQSEPLTAAAASPTVLPKSHCILCTDTEKAAVLSKSRLTIWCHILGRLYSLYTN